MKAIVRNIMASSEACPTNETWKVQFADGLTVNVTGTFKAKAVCMAVYSRKDEGYRPTCGDGTRVVSVSNAELSGGEA